MKNNLNIKWLLLLLVQLLFVQAKAQINTAEYFFDTDPGVGNGLPIAVTIINDSATFNGAISTNGLLPGLHKLYIRASKTNGSWSQTETRQIKIFNNGTSISKAEYFFDTDPGIGNGTNLAINGFSDSASFSGNIATIGLSGGNHQLYIRTQNANGIWGNTETKRFRIISANAAIVAAEYFFDTDPGVGNGFNLPITSISDSAINSAGISTTGLTSGFHNLYIRTINSAGIWGNAESRKFKIGSNAAPILAEYFVDTDPGVGNGIAVNLTDIGGGMADYTGNFSPDSSVGSGNHKLYMRAKDNEGRWGLTDSASFYINCGAWFRDYDADGFGNVNDTVQNCTQPFGYVLNSTDCNDSNANEKPNQLWYIDADADGYAVTGSITNCSRPMNGFLQSELTAIYGDCNDANANINAGSLEICDGIDNDCDGLIDENLTTAYYADADGDGYGNLNAVINACTQPSGYILNNTDCNDNNASIHAQISYYIDADQDGFGGYTLVALCSATAPNGYATITGDCNDYNGAVYPNASEICDGIDNDCDGLIDMADPSITNVLKWFADADADGFGSPIDSILQCAQPIGYVANNTDCNDANALEKPNQIWYTDADGDDYATGIAIVSCTRPTNAFVATELVAINGDCNDANANINAGITEVCDGIDNDCDGLIDENVLIAYYTDADADGFGTGVFVNGCNRPTNGFLVSELINITGDCNDNNASIKPNSQYFTYTNKGDFVGNTASPLLGSSYTTFSFEAIYFDSTNAMPPATYPRAILDYEGNGNYTGSNDRNIIMSPADVNDSTTIDGKKYIGSINSLPTGSTYQTIIQTNTLGCSTNFGPFNYPDVVVLPDVQIFANDITFSNVHPATSSPLTISAIVKNVSDYPAQNFVVHLINQFDTLIIFPDIVISNLAAHTSTTVSWNITTPNVPAWCPMQVVIDYTNAIAETNELDNKAVRPFINGNFNLPGSILVTADVSPKVSTTISNFSCTIFGTAHYTGTAVPLLDSSCAGATVDVTIAETGASFNGYTNSLGNYAIGFPKPLAPGTYHANVHITDYTLDGYDTTDFTVVFVVNPCFTDLSASINLTANSILTGFTTPTILAGESINGTITITNNGCGNSVSSTYMAMSQSGGSFTIPNFSVPALAPGASFSSSFSNLIFNTPGTYQVCGTADANNVVLESSENNNGSCAFVNVVTITKDITIAGCTNGSASICNNPNGINIVISNSGLGNSGVFDVKTIVAFNGLAVDSFVNTMPNMLGNTHASISIPYLFNSLGNYTFSVFTDVNNSVAELYESNNNGVYNFGVYDCKPDLVMLGCGTFDAIPSNPQYTGTLTITASFANTGNLLAIAPFDITFTLSGGTTVTSTYTTNLLPGQSGTVTVSVSAPLPATQSITASIDASNIIAEFAESNNSISDNLCWEFYPTSMCDNSNFWGQSSIKNQAINLYLAVGANYLYDAVNLEVNFTVSGPGLVGNVNLGNATIANAGNTCYCPNVAYLTNNFVFPDAGLYTFTMTVDPNNVYTECNEANNVMVRTMSVSDQADMRVLSQFINPSLLNPNVGQNVTFDISYENIGASNVNDSMELFLQINNTPFDSIKPVGGLITNDNGTIHFSTPWSSLLPGVHIVRAIIDHDNQITESNELNNEATRAIIVGSLPNLYVQLFTATNLVPTVNDNILIQGRIGNDGDSYIQGDVQLSYINNNLDTIIIGQQAVSIPANDSAIFSIPWMVLDAKTSIIAKLINSSSLETTYDDNIAELQLGAMITTIAKTPSCNGNNLGTATATTLGGEPPYNYVWSNGASTNVLTASTGIYTVTTTDITGQTISKTVTILSEALPTLSVSATPISFVVGGSSVLNVSGAFSYSWANAATLNTVSGSLVLASPIVTTIYTVTGASAFGCTNTKTIVVIVIPNLAIASTFITQPTCNNLANAIIATTTNGGTNPISFTINPNVGLQTSLGVFSNLPANTYTITAQDALGNTTFAISTITNPAPIAINIVANNTTLNSGDNLQLSINTSSSIATYNWAGPNIILSTANIFSQIVNANNSGIYTATVADANGCTQTGTIAIAVIGIPKLAIKVLLSGPFDVATNLMHDSLRVNNLIPITEPFSTAPYNTIFTHVNGGGAETIGSNVLNVSGNNAIVDWVFVQLRSKLDSSIVVATKSALVQRDGDVVDASDGISPIQFTNNIVDEYFVSIKHRNHLGIMTLQKMLISSTVTNLDFTSTATSLFLRPGRSGNPVPLSGATRIQNSMRTLYAGNCNISLVNSAYRFVTYNALATSDRQGLFAITGGTNTLIGYSVFDLDLNGFTRFNGFNSDRIVILNNTGGSNQVITNEQTPN